MIAEEYVGTVNKTAQNALSNAMANALTPNAPSTVMKHAACALEYAVGIALRIMKISINAVFYVLKCVVDSRATNHAQSSFRAGIHAQVYAVNLALIRSVGANNAPFLREGSSLFAYLTPTSPWRR